MYTTLSSKHVNGVGRVEMQVTPNLVYLLVVNDAIKKQSSDRSFIQSEYDKIW